MFGIGMSEMVIILAVALLVFGPNKLPEIAKQIAKGLKEIRKAGDDLKSSVNFDLDDDHPRPRIPVRSPLMAPLTPANIPGSELADKLPTESDPEHKLATGSEPEHTPPGENAVVAPKPAAEAWPKPADGAEARPDEKS